jgi:hypothetical protein
MRLVMVLALALLAAPACAAADGAPPIMPLSQVHGGMDCTGETVVRGTTISPFDVHVIDVVQDPTEGPRILVSASGGALAGTGVAEGFSGSPVYCPSAAGTPENIGAISESIGQFGNDVVLVTPIQQMLAEPLVPPSSAPRLAMAGRPLLAPLSAGGLSRPVMHLLQLAARHAGRTVLASSAAPTTGFPVQQLVPGAAVATSYSTGAIGLGAIGTVTYRDGNTIYAFGHPLDDVGRRSLLLQDAYVYDVIGDPSPGEDTSYKLAAPGHTVGTLTSDTPNAVAGTVGPAPVQIPVEVTARDADTGAKLTLDTRVADETALGNPLGSSSVDLIAPLAVAQAATQIYNGAPARESGRMCFTVSLRESRRPFHFCNRYVGTGAPGDSLDVPPELALDSSNDAASALDVLDNESFASLHITGVSADISASRGLDEATILSAQAPRHVRAGQRVPVRLRIRVYRGPVRTVSFRTRIPSGARGTVLARITNPGTGGGLLKQLVKELSQAFGGGGGGRSAPSTISELRRAFDSTRIWDGLDIRFAGHPKVHALYDRAVLINGSVELTFQVRR